MTRQRRAILAAFEDTRRPLSAVEIHAYAQDSVKDINLATVYRNIKGLLESEVIVAVEVPGQPPRYEPSDLKHHHHFLCRVCDRVFDLPGCPGALESLAPPGFVVTDHDLMLAGNCKSCG